MNQFFSDFKKRVKRIAFTDSVHAFNPVKVPPAKWAWLAKVNEAELTKCKVQCNANSASFIVVGHG